MAADPVLPSPSVASRVLPAQVRPATVRRRRGRPRKSDQEGLPSARDVLLEAAAKVFAGHGFEYATLDQIAREAGFAQSAIYNHFGGKPELLLEVVKSTFGTLRLIRGAPDARLRTPRVLSDFVRGLLSPENATLRALTVETHVAARHDREVRRLLGQYHRNSVVLIRDLIVKWQDAELIPAATEAEQAAQMFLTLALGLCNLETLSPEFLGDERWLAMVDTQIDALLGRRKAPRRSSAARG